MMVWHQAYRFGRMLPRDLSRTRALGEHFSSVSHYLWHRRNAEYLLAPLRQAVLRRASLTLGEFARADQRASSNSSPSVAISTPRLSQGPSASTISTKPVLCKR